MQTSSQQERRRRWRQALHVMARGLSACALLLLGAGVFALEIWRAGGMGGRSAGGQLLLLGAIAGALVVMPALSGALLSRSMGALPRTGAVLMPLAVAGSCAYVLIGALATEARADRTWAMVLVSSVTLFLGLWLVATERASWQQYGVLLLLALLLARCVPLAGLPAGVAAWVLLPVAATLLGEWRGLRA